MAIDVRHQIVVYPSRRRLLRYMLLYLVIDLALVLAGIWFLSGAIHSDRPENSGQTVLTVLNVGVVIIIDILAWLLALSLTALLVCTIYRVIAHKPSVIVNSDGIVDRCSLIAGGLGLLRWGEIQALMSYEYKKGTAYLFVMPCDGSTFPAPDNPLAWLFQRSITFMLPVRSGLPQWLLSLSVDELVAEIQQHYGQTIRAYDITVLR